MRTFESPDGIRWGVEIAAPGASNAMVMFRHPDDRSSRLDRYNWFISTGPEARSVTSRLSPKKVMEAIDDSTLAKLFARSMPVTRPEIETHLAMGLGAGAAGLADGIGRIKARRR